MDQAAVVEAIRRAGAELGRAPSRAELKRLTGLSHFVVLKHFPTLRHAIEAAGFVPHIKGRRASETELLEDYGRVARMLGRRPSRAEYARAGKFSAGTFTQRFGGWLQAGEEWERWQSVHREIGSSGQLESPKSQELEFSRERARMLRTEEKQIGSGAKVEQDLQLPNRLSNEIVEQLPQLPELGELPKSPKSPELPKLETAGVTNFKLPDHPITQLAISERPAFILRPGQPAEIPGMRCVTEEVAAMIVAGLLGPRKWRLEIGEVEFTRAGSPQMDADERRSEGSNQHSAIRTQPGGGNGTAVQLPKYQLIQLPNSADPSQCALRISPAGSDARKTAQLQLPNQLSNEIVISRRAVSRAASGWHDGGVTRSPDERELLRRLNVEVVSGRLKRDRPVMGPPLHVFPLTNAPCNEAGVAALFCMIAPDLGFQIEAIQSAFPDCEARRQVRKGKWQRVRIEFEYESRNFPLHHHDPSKCDMIVCWRHNWKKCPEEIEVLELRKMICIG